MKNKTIGTIIVTAIGTAIFAGMIELEAPMFAENIYLLAGLALMVFGTWGAIRLIKSDK